LRNGETQTLDYGSCHAGALRARKLPASSLTSQAQLWSARSLPFASSGLVCATGRQNRPLTVMGQDAAFGAMKFAAKLGHDGLKTDRHKLDANILVGAVVVGRAGWTCLRKDRTAGRFAVGAAQAFRPLVALSHLPSMPHSRIQNTQPYSNFC
jgi:hypothetical protein